MKSRASTRSVARNNFRKWVLVAQALVVMALPWAAFAGDGPILVVDGDRDATDVAPPSGLMIVPVALVNNGHPITSIAFSLDLDLDQLAFDPTDGDGDGVPDAVRFPQGAPSFTFVDFDPTDELGELDVALADLSGLPLAQGVFMVFEVATTLPGIVTTWLSFSTSPEASFGNDQGQTVPGTTVVLPDEIFVDGFESGDASAWSAFVPGFGEDSHGR